MSVKYWICNGDHINGLKLTQVTGSNFLCMIRLTLTVKYGGMILINVMARTPYLTVNCLLKLVEATGLFLFADY